MPPAFQALLAVCARHCAKNDTVMPGQVAFRADPDKTRLLEQGDGVSTLIKTDLDRDQPTRPDHAHCVLEQGAIITQTVSPPVERLTRFEYTHFRAPAVLPSCPRQSASCYQARSAGHCAGQFPAPPG